MTDRLFEFASGFRARLAGGLYLVIIVLGIFEELGCARG